MDDTNANDNVTGVVNDGVAVVDAVADGCVTYNSCPIKIMTSDIQQLAMMLKNSLTHLFLSSRLTFSVSLSFFQC